MTSSGPRGNARGDARREVLRAAAAQVLVEQGFAGLTHRAVAERGGVPLASTTYYFASADDLAVQALQHATQAWLAASEAAFVSLPGRLGTGPVTARAVLAVVTAGSDDRATLATMYERYLEAGRHALLRPLVATANQQVAALVTGVLRRAGRRPGTARLVLATTDGLLLTALAEGHPEPVAHVVPELSRLVALLPRD